MTGGRQPKKAQMVQQRIDAIVINVARRPAD
jgi:hypothetical protein